MKNLTGKTLIFYTFQQKKQLESNVIAYQPQQQPILIKDVLEKLPINLSQGRYHFRFKSEFFQGNQKIAGWIDINNLTAKVPLVAGSVYVKILKVKSNAHNKMFNLEKLARVGLGNINIKSAQSINQVRSPNVANPPKEQPKTPISASKPVQIKQQQKLPQTTSFQQINLIDGTVNGVSKPQQPQSAPRPTLIEQLVKPPATQIPTSAGKGQDLFEFEQMKVFKNEQTIQQKIAFFQQTMAAEQLEKQNEAIARDQLQEKIKKWGYSGAKTINNLTTLLSTLHMIWPEWPELSLTELLNPDKLVAHTKKALIKTHPDKNRKKQFRDKYLAKRVFELINQARKAASISNQ